MSGTNKIFSQITEKDYLQADGDNLSFLQHRNGDRPDNAIFIKPNLTFRHYKGRVLSNPPCFDQLVIAPGDYSENTIFCESGRRRYNWFSMENIFEKNGMAAMINKHNVSLVNPSRLLFGDIFLAFYLKGQLWDYHSYLAFSSPFMVYTANHSPFAEMLHRGIYSFRSKFYDHK